MSAQPLELRLSRPAPSHAPRAFDAHETRTLHAIADVLIPATADDAAATAAADFDHWLARAMDARVDAFDDVVSALAALGDTDAAALSRRLEQFSESEPDAFYLLSTVIAGAWLMNPQTRAAIGYSGPTAVPAPIEQGTEEISDGILDPVLEREPFFRPTPV